MKAFRYKSQQLLLKHNLEFKYNDIEDEEKVLLKRIMKQTKKDAKMRSIAQILQTFFVSPVFNRIEGDVYLEILGNAVNVEIAHYVSQVLHQELDMLWHQAKKLADLKGMMAKNSFFVGIARGYCQKIEGLKKEYTQVASHTLMIIEKKLVEAQFMIYQRLVSTRSSGNSCGKSSALGEQMGRQLNIKPAICKATQSTALISNH